MFFIEKVILSEAHYINTVTWTFCCKKVTFYSITGCESSYLSYSDVIKTWHKNMTTWCTRKLFTLNVYNMKTQNSNFTKLSWAEMWCLNTNAMSKFDRHSILIIDRQPSDIPLMHRNSQNTPANQRDWDYNSCTLRSCYIGTARNGIWPHACNQWMANHRHGSGRIVERS